MAVPLPPLFNESIIATNLIVVAVLSFLFYRAINSLNLPPLKKRVYSILPAVLLLAWLFLVVTLSQTGFFQQLSAYIPNIGLLFVPIALGLTLLRDSTTLNKALQIIPMHWLIAVQFFRMLGWHFLDLHSRGLMPWEFAFPSGYGDILVGLTAPVVAYVYYKKKPYATKLAIAWNIVGIIDLAAAIFLGFFTSPTLYQTLAHDLPNALLFAWPLALVPTFAVPLSLLLHAFSLKVLLGKKSFSN